MTQQTIPGLILENASIQEAIQVIDESSVQIALVHKDGRLVGSVTDGDVRRGLIAGIPVSEPISRVMNESPITIPEGITDDAALAIMRRQHIHQLPVVDSEMQIVGLKTLDDLISTKESNNLVVLMAGGLGTRLHPITEDTPKPLIKVGDKPIIETIIRGFAESGFSNFCIAVNYKADMITDYLGDGSDVGVAIDYIHETQRMGTVGALSLLKQKPTAPFFVMNGDLLTTLNYRQLMAFHQQNGAPVTVCVREHKVTIPYGVLDVEDGRVHTIREKPVQCFLVSAGIYVLSPEVFDFITAVEALDMPALLGKLVDAGTPPAVFPMREYWIDIGQLDDLQRASDEFSTVFSGS